MSEFDDNPFADPFAEPSIREATQPASVAANNTLADYDPFSAPPVVNNVAPTQHEPAVVTPTTIPSGAPPAYTQSAQQQVSAAEFQELKRRQEELERKAQELARKEEELRHATSGGARQDNWPPLPAGCPVGPCFYQDINVDIPSEFQKIVRMLYYLWMFHVLMLMVNVLGSLALYISLGEGQTFGLSILYLIVFSPASYLCWFRPVYKAFRSDSSFNFMVFFFVFFFQMLISIAQAVGIPSIGACLNVERGLACAKELVSCAIGDRSLVGSPKMKSGWIGVGKAFNNGAIGTGVFLILVALSSSALAGSCAILLIWVHRIYRSTGASIAKAQAEFAQGVMRNEHVQNVATNAASAAVRNQFSAQSPAGSTASSGPRF